MEKYENASYILVYCNLCDKFAMEKELCNLEFDLRRATL